MAIKVGVIGVGYLGTHHARIYSSLAGVELKFIVDENSAAAVAAAEKYKGRPISDYRQMLGKVDAVSIVTPTTLHHSVAMECLKAGVHVMVEKPITVTLSEADELCEEAARRNLVLQVGHLERFNPSVVKLLDMVKEPLFIEAERASPFLGRAADVDVTLDLMIHDIDIVFALVGDRKLVDLRAAGVSVITDRIDSATAWMEFQGGVTARLTATRVAGDKRRLLGVREKAVAYELDYQKATIMRHEKVGRKVQADSISVEPREPLYEELVDFVDCINKNRRPRVSGEDGRRALDFAVRINKLISASSR